MIFTPSSIDGVFVIGLEPRGDSRGWFARTFCKKEFEAIGHVKEWVQMNHSFTAQKGSIRGMHYQLPPFREIKMVRCIAGSVMDVVVDLRESSPTFLQHVAVELSARNKQMIYIPEGFAHGFQCLEDDCELVYHHTEYYTPGAERGIRYDDPAIHIHWPLALTEISDRDKSHPLLDKHFKGI
ncbi:MAG: dTDP-4-dehydrorhamnose 3,5-epimerase [Chitinophagaceae bacterium]|nr:dTDP-4-dehydrorhamnose 3,5-epimerase [Chitinophagaceae bacterium]